jgi:hypothetical protein
MMVVEEDLLVTVDAVEVVPEPLVELDQEILVVLEEMDRRSQNSLDQFLDLLYQRVILILLQNMEEILIRLLVLLTRFHFRMGGLLV